MLKLKFNNKNKFLRFWTLIILLFLPVFKIIIKYFLSTFLILFNITNYNFKSTVSYLLLINYQLQKKIEKRII